jgi:hypothetical protein
MYQFVWFSFGVLMGFKPKKPTKTGLKKHNARKSLPFQMILFNNKAYFLCYFLSLFLFDTNHFEQSYGQNCDLW